MATLEINSKTVTVEGLCSGASRYDKKGDVYETFKRSVEVVDRKGERCIECSAKKGIECRPEDYFGACAPLPLPEALRCVLLTEKI